MPLGLRKKNPWGHLAGAGICGALYRERGLGGSSRDGGGGEGTRRRLLPESPQQGTIYQAVLRALTADWGGWVCSEIGGQAVALGELMGTYAARGLQEPVVADGDFSLAVCF